jgi:hypothetical protein
VLISIDAGHRLNVSSAGLSNSIAAEEVCELSHPPFTTWFPKEFECAICKTKNIFMVWGSYGNYIYQWPSKYQLVFWPHTESPAWYSCRKCRLTVFMAEFENLPAEKIPELRKVLATTTLPAQKELSDKEAQEHPPYLELPMPARLAVAEQVYQVLGRDDEFWESFYRLVGYHSQGADADRARKKSIALVEKRLADTSNQGKRKELLYILGAMRHFLGDDAAALKTFGEAAKLTYNDPALKPENNKGYDAYLSDLIKEYMDMLNKGEGPRQKKAR